jgi:hypothetical protein
MTALLEAQVDPFSLVRCPEPPKRNALVAACTSLFFWHSSDLQRRPLYGRYQGKSGH